MKIAMIFSTPYPPEEGIGNYVVGLSKELSGRGHDVTLVTRGRNGCRRRIISDGIEVVKLPFFPSYPFHVHLHRLFVEKYLDSLEPAPDILHIHSPLSPPVRSSVPIVATIHTPVPIDTGHYERVGLLSFLSRAQSLISYQLELSLLKKSELVTTVSESVASELKDYGLDRKKIIVIGNGVDARLFRLVESRNKNRDRVLFVGRLEHRKGLFDLVECAYLVSRHRSDVRFDIVGKGSLEQRLKERVQQLGLRDIVRFYGFVSKDRLLELYRNAKVFVLPSWYEGLPTVLLEAMACGLPVVGTSVSGTREVIDSGYNGVLVRPKSPSSLARALSKLLENETLRVEMGKAARATIEKSYTWESIAEKMLKCYHSLI